MQSDKTEIFPRIISYFVPRALTCRRLVYALKHIPSGQLSEVFLRPRFRFS